VVAAAHGQAWRHRRPAELVAAAVPGLLRKVATYVLVAWVALTFNFALPRLAPGDPLDYLLGEEASIVPEAKRQAVIAQFGLDRPVSEQYLHYLGGALRGDLGTSVRTGRSSSGPRSR
jgi:peptide/nickel transport system permease protein